MGPQQNFVSQALNSLIDWLVMQTPAETAVAIAVSHAAKAFCIKPGTLVREALRLCPASQCKRGEVRNGGSPSQGLFG
jgi:hypothetical protein